MKHSWFLLVSLCVSGVLQAHNDTVFRHFTDTVTTITFVEDSTLKQREVIIPTDSTDRRGHYIEAHIGLGYGSLGYSLEGAQNHVGGSFSGLAQIQYAYFFHKHWGIGAGVWFTNYTSFARIGGDYRWTEDKNGQPLVDSDTEQNYHHTASVRQWRERETLHNVGIPVSLQFQYEKEDWKARIFAAAGVAPAFSVSRKYRLKEGSIDHIGYYPAWNLEIFDVHEFKNKDYVNEPCAKGTLDVRPQVDVFADLGALVPLTKSIDLFVGGYFNVSASDANNSDKQPLGWKDDHFTFMDEYKGAYATTMAGASHPWEAGVKIGIHWHYIAPDKHKTEEYYEPYLREDTLIQYIPRTDTVIVAVPEPEPMEAAESKPARSTARFAEWEEPKELRFRKVYFNFDSYELTEETTRYLLSITDTLQNEVPDYTIRLEGHASPEGEPAYNELLAYNRAKAVAEFLAAQGIDKKRIRIAGFGSSVPNDDNAQHLLSRERRVEIKVSKENNENE